MPPKNKRVDRGPGSDDQAAGLTIVRLGTTLGQEAHVAVMIRKTYATEKLYTSIEFWPFFGSV